MDDGRLNSLEATILRILESHQGRENAISRDALFDCVNAECTCSQVRNAEFNSELRNPKSEIRNRTSDRTIRKTIKHLITQHGAAIGSCHWGYFMAETSDEIEEVCRYYDSYGLSSLFVSSKLRKIEMRDYLGQLSMKFQ
jgi:hypothetical protein